MECWHNHFCNVANPHQDLCSTVVGNSTVRRNLYGQVKARAASSVANSGWGRYSKMYCFSNCTALLMPSKKTALVYKPQKNSSVIRKKTVVTGNRTILRGYMIFTRSCEPVPIAAKDSCSWLTGGEPDGVFCWCSPQARKFNMLYCTCCSAHYSCREWVFVLL